MATAEIPHHPGPENRLSLPEIKITGITVHPLRTAPEHPFAFSQGWVRQRSATIIEVATDAGITGWGEAFAQGLEPPAIATATIEHALTPLLLGADPRDTEVLSHRMYHSTRDYGRTGSVIAAISAIDIALWDICGKAAGLPVRRLFGGAFHDRVQVNPHVWGSAIAQAASLQLIAAVPVAHHSIFAEEPIFEYDRSSHPFRQQLVDEPVQQHDGWIDISSRPGLGIEVNREVLMRYRAA